MEVLTLRTTTVLLHRLLHTATPSFRDHRSEEALPTALLSAPAECFSTPTDPRAVPPTTARTTRDGTPTPRPTTASCGGESSFPPRPRPHRCRAAEAVQSEDHASTTTRASRVTIATTTTTSPPARSTLTRQHTCRHRTASARRRDASAGGGREARRRPSRPAARQREGRFLGSAPALTPQGLRSTSTPW